MSAAFQLEPGAIFAREYRIVRPLAEGGMGAVYVAEQLGTGKQRALKLMHPQFVADPRSRARFEQEARIGATLDSDHVVEVVGAGIDDASGVPWLAMELLKGEELAQVMEARGVLTHADVAIIYDQLGHALGAAHAAGIVHRDLKPENVYLAAARRSDVPFTVKVLDFGIAKIVQEARQTRTQAMGSPLWMAPEQTESGTAIKPATDVWALGLIAFHMLTGGYYWRSATGENASLMHLLREIVVEPLEPASARAAAIGRAQNLPPGFDGWFSRCVHRDPTQRFVEARQCCAALVSLLRAGAPLPEDAWAAARSSRPGGAPTELAMPVVPMQLTGPGLGAVLTPAGPVGPGGSTGYPMHGPSQPGPPPTHAGWPNPGAPATSATPWASGTPASTSGPAMGPGGPMVGGATWGPMVVPAGSQTAPQKGSRAGLWIGLGVLGFALVCGGAIAVSELTGDDEHPRSTGGTDNHPNPTPPPNHPPPPPTVPSFPPPTVPSVPPSTPIPPSPTGISMTPIEAPTPTGTVIVGYGTVVGDPLMVAPVNASVHAMLPQFRACYQQALRTNPQITGVMMTAWILEGNGRAQNLHTQMPLDAALSDCVVRAIAARQFPISARRVECGYPLVFNPAAGGSDDGE